MPFVNATRQKFLPRAVITKPVASGLTISELPKANILAAILLRITITITGTLSAPNALGVSSAIRRVRVDSMNNNLLFDVSGPGYAWLLADFINANRAAPAYLDGRAAVTAATFDLDMIIPIALNNRDDYGLFMLQNLTTFAQLQVEWETDTTVATGATITGTATPELVTFEVPQQPGDMPDLSYLHIIQEDQVVASGAGDWDFPLQVGGPIYYGLYGLAPSGFTTAQLIAQESSTIESHPAGLMRARHWYATGEDETLAGALTGTDKRALFDLAGTDGLGQYGTMRDTLNTAQLTSLKTRYTVAGAQTIRQIRRYLIPLAA